LRTRRLDYVRKVRSLAHSEIRRAPIALEGEVCASMRLLVFNQRVIEM
jgi:hypothetical protein